MSEKGVHASPPVIDLVSDEETEESIMEKLAKTKERIAAAKKKLEILDQTEWMMQKRIIEVYIKTTSVKRKIAKIDQEIINISRASAKIPEIAHDIGKLNLGNMSSMGGKSKMNEGSDNESIGSSPDY